MSFTQAPLLPDPMDPATFNMRALAAWAWLAQVVTEFNAATPGESAVGVSQALAAAGETKGAALVGFMSSLPGAPRRTVQGKLRDIVCVDDLFNDGFNPATTECSTHIQSALNAGKTVELVPGRTYCAKNLQSVAGGGLVCRAGRAKILVPPGTGNNGITINTSDFVLDGVDFDGGNYGPYNVSSATEGTRCGVIIGNPFGTNVQLNNITVQNSDIKGFDRAGVYGQEVQIGFVFGKRSNIFNVNASKCYVGIWSTPRFEYVTGVSCFGTDCKAGIVLQGGNNRWVAGAFEHNYYNCQMGGGENNSHGAFIGTSFNHAAAGGYGLKATGVEYGQVFTGCLFWYAPIDLENCVGIAITHGQIANSTVTITDGGLNRIDDNYTPLGLTKTFNGLTFTSFRRNRVSSEVTDVTAEYGDVAMMSTEAALAYPISWNSTTDTKLPLTFGIKKWHGVDAAFLSPSNDVYIPRTGYYEIDARVVFDVSTSAERVVLKAVLSRAGSAVDTVVDSAYCVASRTDCTVSISARMLCQAGDILTFNLRTLTAAGISIKTDGIRVQINSVD